ncbi:hypothetical protein GCM10027046_39350 [Uliginosibacterium flavum]|uniref:Sec translocon accessory complex subunit YajC n=1 Tax=Uliginosibacterium flavum TaxID=1396831 RepID=A0ABV2TKL8_9RHOO
MFISDAYAQTATTAAQAGPDFMSLSLNNPLFMFGAMGLAMYFLIFRPQQTRAKEHRALLDALAAGDEVITQGGIAGKVASVGDNFIKVEIASGVEITVQKPAISAVLPKGTLKNS